MALVLANRVQESATANTTVSFTLTGAVTGFQTFAIIGDTNTTYYSATDTTGNWEVGLGTYSTTGPTLTRTTIYASSNSNLAVTFSGTVNVFVTYPSGRSVNLNETGNVSALGTVSSGTWQGTTIGVAYGGTGVTTSSGANSVVLRDANQNITVNRVSQANTNTTAAGGTTVLTTASSYIQSLVGTGGQTYALPDATTLTTGVAFIFNNLATGTLTIQNFAAGAVGTIPSGGAGAVFLTANATVGGTWDLHGYLPEGVTFGTNALNLGSTVVSGGTWQGGTIQPAYGGTGLTTFVGANNALYSTGATTLTAGTLPVAAGGTGITAFGTGVATALGVNVGTAGSFVVNGGALGTPASGTVTNLTGTASININGTVGSTTPDSGAFTTLGASGNLAFTGTGNRITGDFSNATIANRVMFQTSTAGGNTRIGVLPNNSSGGTSGPILYSTNDPANSSFLDVRVTDGIHSSILSDKSGTGTFLPMTFFTGGSERMRLDTSGNVGIGTSSPSRKLDVQGAPSSVGGSGTGVLANFVNNTTAFNASPTAAISLWNRINSGGSTFPSAVLQAGKENATDSNYAGYMSFQTTDASGVSTERMRVTATGDVGIGTSSPGARLDVLGSTGILTRAAATQDGVAIVGRAGGTSSWEVTITPTTLSADRTLTLPDNSGTVLTTGATTASVQFGSFGVGTAASGTTGEIRATNNITAYFSDDRLKTKLGKIENALDKLCRLEGFYYEPNETAQALGYEVKREVGVSAQQVQAVMPEIVAPAPIDDKYLTVRYERALPLLIEAIKELREELRALKA